MADKIEEQRLPFIRDDLFSVPSEAGQKPHLIGSKCKTCGRFFFPKRIVCYYCKEASLEQVFLSRRGKLEAGTVSHIAPVGFKAPYVVGYVILPEGVRFFTQLIVEGVPVEKAQEELKPGRGVELVVEKIREDDRGNDVLGFKFKVL